MAKNFLDTIGLNTLWAKICDTFPSKTGQGASGTWDINIKGNANTANSVSESISFKNTSGAKVTYNGGTAVDLTEGINYSANTGKFDSSLPSAYLRLKSSLTNNTDFNVLTGMGFYPNTTGNGTGNTNNPCNYGWLLNLCDTSLESWCHGVQMSFDTNQKIQVRHNWDPSKGWLDWIDIITSKNIGDYVVSTTHSHPVEFDSQGPSATVAVSNKDHTHATGDAGPTVTYSNGILTITTSHNHGTTQISTSTTSVATGTHTHSIYGNTGTPS